MRHFIQPVAKKVGIGNISWHTFRHTYSTLLHANGEDPKVVQELLRHSSIKVTMDVYTQAVTATKRKAQSRAVEMIVPKKPAGQWRRLDVTYGYMDRRRPMHVTSLESWRPRRDLNPCYRRERAMS
jgi:hypothetical protein